MTNEPGYLGQFAVIAVLAVMLLGFTVVAGAQVVDWFLDLFF
jgi:hypothetical protein